MSASVPTPEASGPTALPDPLVMREGSNKVTAAAGETLPWPKGMQETSLEAVSLDGTKFEVRRFVPQAVSQRQEQQKQSGDAPIAGERGIIYVFGGGLIAGSINVLRRYMATLAEATGTQVFAPEWRIAPEHPYPAGLEDVYATVLWLQAEAAKFQVDPKRVVLFGLSAGGTLGTAAALMARDKKLTPPIAALCLRYPMLDDQTTLAEDSPIRKSLTWSVEPNDAAWKAYLSGRDKWDRTDENTPYYAAPSRAKDLTGMPPTLIGVGGLDLFKEECLKFGFNLGMAGVEVGLHLYPDVPHGFDMFTKPALAAKMRENELRFIEKF